MAALPSNLVYEGYWVDWSVGRAIGATITIRSSAANAILAALTILVAFTGTHLWNLIAFIYFSFRASDEEKIGLHHHQQFLLRNVSDPLRYVFHGLKVVYSWRKLKLRRQWPMLLSICLAACLGVGFAAAGVLVSRIVTTTDLLVQVNPPVCGHWRDKSAFGIETEEQSVSSQAYVDFAKSTWQFARQCYGGAFSEACKVFPRQEIDYQTSYGECPFGENCKVAENPALIVDTGNLNSNDVFGINARSADQVNIRLKTTCAVVNSTRYTQNVTDLMNSTVLGRPLYPSELFTGWYLGDAVYTVSNFTWAMSSYTSNGSQTYQLLETHFVPLPNNTNITNYFVPYPEFENEDAGTVLLGFAASGLEYSQAVDDPLFSAHVTRQYDYGTGELMTKYRSDNLIEVLGCYEQFQFCPSDDSCTSLTSSAKALDQAFSLPLTATQNATVRMFKYLIDYDYLAISASMAGLVSPPPIKAADHMQQMGDVIGLPDNQWETEVNGLFALVLASLQKGVTDLATGPLGGTNDTQYYSWLTPPVDAAEQELCHAQKMDAPGGYSNISVLGMALTIALCGVIILTDFVVTPLITYLARYQNNRMSLSVRHWIGDGMLQVQRKAFEGLSISDEWNHYDHEVPVTKEFGTFHGLSVGDEDAQPDGRINFLSKVGRKLSSMSSVTRFSSNKEPTLAIRSDDGAHAESGPPSRPRTAET